MTYDSLRGRVVLFGGSGGGFLNDTWEWDGSTWTRVFPANSPGPRQTELAYDSVRMCTVSFGGWNGAAQRLSDTWTWDGTNWTQRSPTNVPTGRQGALMANDPIRGRVVMHGGGTNTIRLTDTWEWDGSNWTLAATVGPGASGDQMVWHPTLAGMVVVNGNAGTWLYRGSSWAQLLPAAQGPHPVAYSGAALACDTVRNCLVTFWGDCTPNRQTWEMTYAPPQCPGTLIANGSFTTGLVAGPMQSGGAVTSWSRLTGDPNVIGNSGCTTNGCMQLSGNQTTGDSIRQAATGFLPRHVYRIKFCHRFVSNSSSPQTSVRFRISATTSDSPTDYPSSSSSYTLVCLTPATSSTTWTEYQYNWTPTAAVANLAINAESDLTGTTAATMAWGEIDDLCIVELPVYAAFVFDRSDDMGQIGLNGQIRADNSIAAASAPISGDIDSFFLTYPLAKAQIYELLGASVYPIGGSGHHYDSAATAKAALGSLSPLQSGKPLALALCTATNGLVALDPSAERSQRKLFLYSCPGDENSDIYSCKGTLPDALLNENRCAEMPADGNHPNAFFPGSWQAAVCTIVHGSGSPLHDGIELHAYYWDDFRDTAPLTDFIEALCDVSGGSIYRVWDGSTAPVVNPWRVQGTGCSDFQGTRLSMHHDGIPQVGETIQIGCRTSSALPYVLGVGFQNTSIGAYQLPLDLSPFGAPRCSLYTSWDVTDSFVLWGGMRSIAIPPAPALAGLTLYWQGLQPHQSNNTLGIATSNLLKVTIAP